MGEHTYNGTFGTLLACMDGRPFLSLLEYLGFRFGEISWFDPITAKGSLNGIFDGPASVRGWYRSEVVDVSMNVHGSRLLVVAFHDDCAGDQSETDKKIELARDAIAEIEESWDLPEGVRIHLIRVVKGKDDFHWEPESIWDSTYDKDAFKS